MSADFDKLRDIFLAALAQAPDQRDTFLHRLCGGDEALRRDAAVMLKAHAADGPLDRGPLGGVPPAEEAAGVVIGPYTLLEPIGEGGMGTVWLARQTVPFERLVAVKFIKPGMDTKQVIARFEAERQALALMDHPNIARVLDAGSTPPQVGGTTSPHAPSSGRPYFVMDLVQGVPITRYCDDHQLTPRQRLGLFVSVCAAVQHAHQKGVIHRDIKPSNVLVAGCDGVPVPKVIDFGVAKATGQELTEKTLLTGLGTLVGTLEYMSPEQAELNQPDVDTRSDIYSLGVLLYELLTGTTPLDRERVKAGSLLDTLHAIREEEPPRPSSRIRKDARRVSSPSFLLPPSSFQELDWIVLKALEKDRARRYETASAFAEDVQRYLADEPVRACPPAVGYRLRKFARRNKVGLAAAAACGAALVAAVVTLAVSAALIAEQRDAAREAAAEADRERRRADANATRARRVVDDVVTQVAADLANVPRMEQVRAGLLEEALKFYKGLQQEYATDPGVRFETAHAAARVGDIHLQLRDFAQAEATYREAIGLLERLIADHPREREYREALPGFYARYSSLHAETGQVGRQREAYARHVELLADLVAAHPAERGYRGVLVSGLVTLAGILETEHAGRDAVEAAFRRAFAVHQQARADFPGPPGTADNVAYLHWGYGRYLTRATRFAEAEAHLRTGLQLYQSEAARHPDSVPEMNYVVVAKADLAQLLNRTGRGAEAERLYRDVTAAVAKRLDEFPHVRAYLRQVGRYQEAWGLTLFGLGRVPEAERAFRDCLATTERLVRETTPPIPGEVGTLGWSHYHLGELLNATGRAADAAEQFRLALRRYEQNVAKEPGVARYQYHLAWLLAACPDASQRDPARALRHAQLAVRTGPGRAAHWTCLGIAQYRAGRWQEAIDALEKALQLDPAGDGFEWFYLALARAHLGQKEKARQEYDAGVRWVAQHRYAELEVRPCSREAAALLGLPNDSK